VATQAARDWLALTGFDPTYGARPLRRLIQTTIEDQLARRVLSGQVLEGDTITFDLDPEGDALHVVTEAPVAA
jgi:ATP-dependent Clp protease ATP-binding subunit ClpB